MHLAYVGGFSRSSGRIVERSFIDVSVRNLKILFMVVGQRRQNINDVCKRLISTKGSTSWLK